MTNLSNIVRNSLSRLSLPTSLPTMLWIQQGANTLREPFSFREMITMRDTLSRRRFLQATTTTAAFMAGPGWLPAEERTSDTLQSLPAQACRFVHLTDIHVQPERRAVEGLVQCLNAVMRLDPQPEFIVTGGDLVMDVFEQDEQRARSLFPLLRKVFEEHTDLPVHHCIGNHDVFGWGSNGVDNTHPAYGKKMVSGVSRAPWQLLPVRPQGLAFLHSRRHPARTRQGLSGVY